MEGDLSESNLDKTFNLGKRTNNLETPLITVLCPETAADPPQSPEPKPDPRPKKSATVVKSRPPPLEKKPAVPPKPSRMLLANPARKTSSSDVATNILKPKTSAMKRPKIKSPFLPSPGRNLIPVKKVSAVKEVSPLAPKNPLGSEMSRKDSLIKERRTLSASKPIKDFGRKSLAAAGGGQRENKSTNNNQSNVPNRNKVLSQRTAPAKSPMSVNTGSSGTESVGSSSSLQRRRKSVGDVMKSSSLAARKPATATPSQPLAVARLASQPRRSLSNSSLKRAGTPGVASSRTPTLQSNHRRNSVSVQSKITRDKPENSSRMKSSRPDLDLVRPAKKPAYSEERKLQKAVLEENKKKFDVLALVASTVIEENDKLKKIIMKSKVSSVVFRRHHSRL